MNIKKIKFTDFRCFYGEQILELAGKDEENKKITLIHAENGVGKTTILNAILWCLFGKTTESFEQKSNLVNNDAVLKGKQISAVEIDFTHEKVRYKAKREYSIKTKKDTFQLYKFDRSGSMTHLENAMSFIKTIMPEDMAGYFLFDGEHVEKFARGNSALIRDAIRDILGCTIVEAGKDDLRYLIEVYNKELKDLTPDDSVQDVTERILRLQQTLSSQQRELEALKKEKDAKNDQVEKIEDYLRATAEAAHLQKRRDDIEEEKEYFLHEEKRARYEKKKWLGENLINIVSKKLYTTSLDFLDDQIKKGRVPEPYNKEFIQTILESKTCICGRPLDTEESVKQIKEMLDSGADALMRDKVAKARTKSALLKEYNSKVHTKIIEIDKRCSDALSNVETCEQKLKEISDQLKGKEIGSNIGAYEIKRTQLQKEVDNHNQEIGSLQKDIKTTSNRIRAEEDYQRDISKKNPALAALQCKIDFARDLKTYLEEELNKEEKNALQKLQLFISETANAIMRKHVQVKVDENYKIHMKDENGAPLAKSGGENQMLGLAFTIALIKFAKDRQKSNHSFLLSGTEAPLILDSPFGQLDPVYRKGTASFLAKADGQTALLLSRSQASDEVMEEIRDNIGKEYILVRHNVSSESGKPIDQVLDSSGNVHTVTEYGSTFNGAKIVEV